MMLTERTSSPGGSGGGLPPAAIEIEAGSPEEAIAQAARQSGAEASELRVVETRPMRRMPWQPRRAIFVLARSAPAPEREQTPAGRDGTWQAEFHDGSVWLTVSAPQGEGRRVRLDEVLAESKNWPLEEVDKAILSTSVEKASGQADNLGYYGTAGSTPFRVVVAPSDAVAYIICGDQAPEGDGKAAIVAALEEVGVTHGVDTERIEAMLNDWHPAAAVLVAHGAAPVAGTDATVEHTFVDESAHPVIREDGTADFFASQLTPPVAAGSPVAIKHPATPGTPGYTIRGIEIPPQAGKDVDLKKMLGKGVGLSEDGLQVLASADGTPSSLGSKYSVLPSLRIDGEVGPGTGNVNFPGSVMVGGDVLDGFTLKADGDITVRGVAQAATLEAGGNVILMAGMFGRERGTIAAAGDIRAAFLNECSVRTEGNVLVSGEIVRSNVIAKGSVQVAGSGKIIGGTISSGEQIVANTIGSPIGRVATRLILPNASGWRADGEGAHSQPVDDEASPSADDAAATAAPASEVPTEVDPKAPTGPRIAVKVRGVVYPPTHILIGHARRTIDLEVQYAMFVEGQEEVVMAPLA